MTALAGYKANVYFSTGVSTPFTNMSMTDAGDHMTFTASVSAQRYLDPNQPLTVQTAPDGVTWTTVTTGFTVQYCGGVIVFASPVAGGTPSCRISAGNYLVFSQAGQAFSIDVQTTINKLDNTTFASAQANNGFITQQAGLGGHTWKLSNWHIDNFFFSQAGNLVLISAYTGANANQRLEGYGLLTGDNIKIDIKALNQEDLTVDGSGPIYWIAS